jgi:hypothetical protein
MRTEAREMVSEELQTMLKDAALQKQAGKMTLSFADFFFFLLSSFFGLGDASWKVVKHTFGYDPIKVSDST